MAPSPYCTKTVLSVDGWLIWTAPSPYSTETLVSVEGLLTSMGTLLTSVAHRWGGTSARVPRGTIPNCAPPSCPPACRLALAPRRLQEGEEVESQALKHRPASDN